MFTCLVCDKIFKFKEKYKRHTQTHLAKEENSSLKKIVTSKQNTFMCDKCEYSCTSQSSLHIHIQRLHIQLKYMACEFLNCKRSFKTKDYLKFHEKNFHGKIKIRCNECPKTFGSKYKLKKHMNQIHREIGDHHCVTCKKNFWDKRPLEDHIKTVHLKILSFKCNTCFVLFSNRGNMVRHIKDVHQKTKNFRCVICDLCFSQNTSLQGHMKKNHSNKTAGNTAEKKNQRFHGWKGVEISLSHQNGVALATLIAEVEDSLAKTVLKEFGKLDINQKEEEIAHNRVPGNSNAPIEPSNKTSETIDKLESILNKFNLNNPNIEFYKESIDNSPKIINRNQAFKPDIFGLSNKAFEKPENVISGEHFTEEKRGIKTMVGITEPFNITQVRETKEGSIGLDTLEAVKENCFARESEKTKDQFHDDFTLCLEAKCGEHHNKSHINKNTTSNIERVGNNYEGNMDLSKEVFEKSANVTLGEYFAEEKGGFESFVGQSDPISIAQELEVIDDSIDLDIFEAEQEHIFERDMNKNKDLFHDDFTLCLEAKCEEYHNDIQIDQEAIKTSNSEIFGKDVMENFELSIDFFEKPENITLGEHFSEEKASIKNLLGKTEPFNGPHKLKFINGLDIFEAEKENIFDTQVENNKDLFHEDFTLCLEAKCEEYHFDSVTNENTTSHCEEKDKLDNSGTIIDKQHDIDSVMKFFEPFFYVCQNCGRKFKLKSSFARHLNRKLSCSTSEDNNTTFCSLCEKTFQTSYKLKRHIKRVHVKTMSFCTFCDKVVKSRQYLKRHIDIVHLKIQRKQFECNDCGKVFNSLPHLQTHTARAH